MLSATRDSQCADQTQDAEPCFPEQRGTRLEWTWGSGARVHHVPGASGARLYWPSVWDTLPPWLAELPLLTSAHRSHLTPSAAHTPARLKGCCPCSPKEGLESSSGSTSHCLSGWSPLSQFLHPESRGNAIYFVHHCIRESYGWFPISNVGQKFWLAFQFYHWLCDCGKSFSTKSLISSVSYTLHLRC